MSLPVPRRGRVRVRPDRIAPLQICISLSLIMPLLSVRMRISITPILPGVIVSTISVLLLSSIRLTLRSVRSVRHRRIPVRALLLLIVIVVCLGMVGVPRARTDTGANTGASIPGAGGKVMLGHTGDVVVIELGNEGLALAVGRDVGSGSLEGLFEAIMSVLVFFVGGIVASVREQQRRQRQKKCFAVYSYNIRMEDGRERGRAGAMSILLPVIQPRPTAPSALAIMACLQHR